MIPASGDSALELDFQSVILSDSVPDVSAFRHWVQITLDAVGETRHALAIRIVTPQEIRKLNRQYRGRDQATNVLSFPFEPIPGIEVDWLGDIVICAAVVEEEVGQQEKSPIQHWSHMVIHGVLHLCGYDHVDETGARAMEGLEVCLLERLGYPDPYGPGQPDSDRGAGG